MSGRFRTLRSRLRDTRGFMLAEQLVSIIFIGLLCVVIAAGLTAALSAYSNITLQTNADNLLTRTVEAVSDEFAFALSVEGDDDVVEDEVYYVSAAYHELGVLMSPELADAVNGGIYLNCDSGQQYKVVPAAHGLIPQLENVVYYRNAATVDGKKIPANTWTFDIKIVQTVGGTPLASTSMTVQRLGS